MKDQRFKKETLWNKIEKEERKASNSKRSEATEQKLKDFHTELEKIEKETIAGNLKIYMFFIYLFKIYFNIFYMLIYIQKKHL